MANAKPYDKQTPLERKRRAKFYTREKLAELSGVSVRTIENWEQGRVDINSSEVFKVLKVAEALDCLSIKEILNTREKA